MQPIVQRLFFEFYQENTNEHSPRNEYKPSSVDFFIPAIAEFIGSFLFTFLTQTLSVIFVGKCRLAIGFFMIFMQFFGSFLGAVYAQCILQDNMFAIAMNAAIKWSNTEIYLANRLQYFFMELTLSTLICCAYLFTGIINHGRNGAMCAAVVSITRVIITFIGCSIIGQTANLARNIGLTSTAYIFLSVHDEWRFIYVPFLVDLISAPIAALIYWISVKYAVGNINSMPKD